MTEEDLKSKLAAIEKQFELDKRAAYIEYAKANNPYKIGDVVTDHMGSLKIERIGYHIAWG